MAAERSDEESLASARAVKDRARDVCAARAEVVGVGITRVDGTYGVRINLACAPPPGADLPREIDGVPIRIEVVGAIRRRDG